MPMLRAHWKSLIIFFAVILLIQFLGSWATFTSVDSWYPTLKKVAWNPPPWVFGPVWTALYVLIALAGWRVWVKTKQVPSAYILQLILNLAWSFLFFYFRRPELAVVEMLALLGSIIWTASIFFRHDRIAGWMFVPYILWVSYAFTLNAGIVVLN